MNTDVEGLELSLKLMYRGISPTLKPGVIDDYTSVKSDLKKIKVNLTVKEIDNIAIIVLGEMGTQNESPAQLPTIKPLIQSKEVIEQVQEVLSKHNPDLGTRNITNVLEIIAREMPAFKDCDYPYSTKHNQYNYAFINRKKVRSELDILFQRVLTKDEFHLLMTEWYRYMAIVMDCENSNNKFKEQVKEIKVDYVNIIKDLEKKISHTNILIDNLRSISRFPNHALSIHEGILNNNQAELTLYKKLLSRLRADKGHELNAYDLRSQAYFAVIFCAETLGLSANKQRKFGNPLLRLLEILLNADESGRDEGDIRAGMSQIYVLYKKHIEVPENKSLVDGLLAECRNNQGCLETIRMSNVKFQASLLFLICSDPFVKFLEHNNKEIVK